MRSDRYPKPPSQFLAWTNGGVSGFQDLRSHQRTRLTRPAESGHRGPSPEEDRSRPERARGTICADQDGGGVSIALERLENDREPPAESSATIPPETLLNEALRTWTGRERPGMRTARPEERQRGSRTRTRVANRGCPGAADSNGRDPSTPEIPVGGTVAGRAIARPRGGRRSPNHAPFRPSTR